ncbi:MULTISPECIES: glycoside hydrolase family 3 protein [unclassified Microbacterium]|uniref:glycoside hydrolase family 3 protein n=1 Tax=unclassified Microbacterium TaxID=2609290 RepID=UPI0012FA8551|nr:glycoside hydrolase family 3 N-terminal domain-containing protein [Microbacterium sp. MAH-37]MVQ41174.1 glycoside hydrolase family 3 protein [Microbacterium sp. MAH-37]
MRNISFRRSVAIAAAVALAIGLGPVAASSAETPPPTGGQSAAHAKDRALEYARSTMASMTLEEKIGQLFILFAYGPTATSADARNTALYGQPDAAGIISEYEPGGFILFSARDNVTDPVQVATLSNGLQDAAADAGAGIPLLVSTDQEQGLVTRIGSPATLFPGNMALGAGGSTKDTRRAAAITGEELLAMGIQQNNAPDADVNVNPDNPVIGVRSFSSDPALVSRLTAAAVSGYQDDAGIIATAKHFPGHGDTATDSHTGLPLITHTLEQWQQIDAPPFQAAIAAGVDSIMTAHIVVPALDDSGDPATLSKKIVTGQLREALGFDGVIVTDGLEMAAVRQKYGDGEVAVRALEAGVDQLLLPAAPQEAYQAVEDALESGRLTEERIDESVQRILVMKYDQGVTTHPKVDVNKVLDKVGKQSSLRAAEKITDRTTTLVRNENGALPLSVAGKKVLVTGYGVVTGQTLADQLAARGAETTALSTGTAPSQASIAQAVAAAQASDVTVVLTNGVTATSSQKTLVAALDATDTHLIVVGVRNPYDINQLGDVDDYIATYSYAAPALASLAKVITGEISPTGKLPVDIFSADDPTQVLYPFGYGLTW